MICRRSATRDRLEQLIVPTFPPPRGFESNGIWFRDEEGKMVEVAVKAKSSPMEKSIFREVSSPAGVPGATLRSRAQITRPRRLSHIALYTTDVSRKLKFYSACSTCDSPTGRPNECLNLLHL
jgi:hypothetical protein